MLWRGFHRLGLFISAPFLIFGAGSLLVGALVYASPDTFGSLIGFGHDVAEVDLAKADKRRPRGSLGLYEIERPDGTKFSFEGIQQFRKHFPQYTDLTDRELAHQLWSKYLRRSEPNQHAFFRSIGIYGTEARQFANVAMLFSLISLAIGCALYGALRRLGWVIAGFMKQG